MGHTKQFGYNSSFTLKMKKNENNPTWVNFNSFTLIKRTFSSWILSIFYFKSVRCSFFFLFITILHFCKAKNVILKKYIYVIRQISYVTFIESQTRYLVYYAVTFIVNHMTFKCVFIFNTISKFGCRGYYCKVKIICLILC